MEKQANEIFWEQIKTGNRSIPVSLDVPGDKITWLDFEQYHFYEGFFHKSHRIFSVLKGGKVDYVTTGIDILLNDLISDGCLYPSGFIFHASRSGSTLLSKVLARSSENLVISEAGPLNSIWNYFAWCEKTNALSDEDKRKIYRNLVMAMGRPGPNSQEHYFVKFTSYNILFFEFIHSVFPDVPAIFVSRDVDSILRSFDEKLPGWLQPGNVALFNEILNIKNIDGRTMVESFLAMAGKYPTEDLLPVDYGALAPDILPAILKHFKVNTGRDQLTLMQQQFLFDSKVELRQKRFNSS